MKVDADLGAVVDSVLDDPKRAYKAPLFFDINDLNAYIQSIRIAAR